MDNIDYELTANMAMYSLSVTISIIGFWEFVCNAYFQAEPAYLLLECVRLIRLKNLSSSNMLK